MTLEFDILIRASMSLSLVHFLRNFPGEMVFNFNNGKQTFRLA